MDRRATCRCSSERPCREAFVRIRRQSPRRASWAVKSLVPPPAVGSPGCVHRDTTVGHGWMPTDVLRRSLPGRMGSSDHGLHFLVTYGTLWRAAAAGDRRSTCVGSVYYTARMDGANVLWLVPTVGQSAGHFLRPIKHTVIVRDCTALLSGGHPAFGSVPALTNCFASESAEAHAIRARHYRSVSVFSAYVNPSGFCMASIQLLRPAECSVDSLKSYLTSLPISEEYRAQKI
ncbi:hypothetical protein MAP00_001436 [Monascus purpureus]|nr:hypothetical protein MAP00_001436 [Monascus purpureus]